MTHDMTAPDTEKKPRPSTDHCLLAGLAGCRDLGRVAGFTITLTPERLIDDQHLDPAFYGGSLGEVVLKNAWRVIFTLEGEVRMHLHLPDGSDLRYENDGSRDLDRNDPGHAALLAAVDSDDDMRGLEKEGKLDVINNNWVTYAFMAPDGTVVEPEDNVLSVRSVIEPFGHDCIMPILTELDAVRTARPD